MDMREGYKQTEAGVIPSDWQTQQLGAVSSITTGRKDVNEGNPDGEYPFFTCSRNRAYSDTYSFDTEAILIAGNGDVGNLHYHKGKFEAYQRTYVVSRFELGVPYIWHQLNYRLIESLGIGKIGSSIPYIKKENLSDFEFPLPPTETEQRAIAEALSDVDALISGLDRLIAKKRDLKQAAMQQLLTGQTRLPGFHGEWEVKRLGEICEISMGRTPARLNQAFWGRGHKWLSISDLQSKVVTESKEEITELAASTMKIVPKGTLLMSFKLSLGRLCFAGCDLFTNEAICSFNKLQADADFLYYALGRTDFSLYGKQAVKGYTLNRKSLELIEVTLPVRPEQTAIAQVLSDMDAALAALETRREKTRQLKQGMMQELLTGRTRLV
tara:strand:- start:1428 stop:2576 length:1149 start_codon:yes stop_codon:yes gene_type:complete